MLFFAGHGATRLHDLGSGLVQTGYLIPADASDRAATWIELEGWLRAVSLLSARHILVILDACDSGIALDQSIKWRDARTQERKPLSTLRERRSRRIITSALDDQVALDSYPGACQTPDLGAFVLDDRGELVIDLKPERWDDDTTQDPRPPSSPEPSDEPTYTVPDVTPIGADDPGASDTVIVPPPPPAAALEPARRAYARPQGPRAHAKKRWLSAEILVSAASAALALGLFAYELLR